MILEGQIVVKCITQANLSDPYQVKKLTDTEWGRGKEEGGGSWLKALKIFHSVSLPNHFDRV